MKMFRMQWTALFAVIVLLIALLIKPEQLFLVFWKLSLVSLAGWLGYLLDRELFPYARPGDATSSKDQNDQMLRRAIVVGAAMLAYGLAV